MTVCWGIVGCGDVVRKRVAAAIVDDKNSSLVALCRRSAAPLRELAEQYQVDSLYSDAGEMIRSGKLDAVYLATPNYLHEPQTLAAAEAGLHVLVEKPMALDNQQCQRMIEACRASGVKLGVAYYRRFYPVVDRIRELLGEGVVGQPLAVDSLTATTGELTSETEGGWRVVMSEGGGGALMDIGSHRINLLLSLFGDVADVRAVCSTVAADYEAENCVTLAARFSSGVQGSVRCFFGAGCDPDEFSVIGTKGRIVAAPLNDGQLTIETDAGRRTEHHPPDENFNAPQIADFVSAIGDDRSPRVDGEEGLRTNDVMTRAYEDARRG